MYEVVVDSEGISTKIINYYWKYYSYDTLPDCDPSLVGCATVVVVAVRKGFVAVAQWDWSWLVQAG